MKSALNIVENLCPYCEKRPLCEPKNRPPKTCGDSACKKALGKDLNKRWYTQNKTRKQENAKSWREKNKTRVVKKGKEWRENNREKEREVNRLWKQKDRQKHPEKYKEYTRRYLLKHPDLWAIRNRKSEYRRYLPSLIKEQDGRCNLCRCVPQRVPDMHIDHIYPVSLALRNGWTTEQINDKTNLQMLCASCNMKKGVKT